MKFGVKLPNSGPFASVDGLRTVALESERLGYDSVWVHDHIHRSVADAQHHFAAGAAEAFRPPIVPNHYEAISTLLYLSGITSRVTLGTSVIVLPLRNPVVLAKEAACLDQFSGGRLILGVGVGGSLYARPELAAIGALHLLGKRGKVTDEWIDVLRGVWREPQCTFQGKFIQVREAEVFPKPLQQPFLPVWIGGFREAALQRVARRGDGWLAISFLPSEIARGKQRIRELAAQAGRDPDGIQIGSEHWLVIAADQASAESRAAGTMKSLGGYLTQRQETDSGRVGQVPERHLFGDPDTILNKLVRYQAAGVDHIILRVIAHEFSEMIDCLHRFKEEVMDRLR